MTVHLVKLCVGIESMSQLQEEIGRRLESRRVAGEPVEQIHTTRMMPKRADELVAGGSLFWVIRGVIECRQPIAAIRPVVDKDGVRRCQLVLNPEIVAVEPRRRSPFQGWRYLGANDAPADLASLESSPARQMPIAMRRELAELGLL